MPYYRQYKVVILGFDGALASAMTGALDLFSFVGISWQRFNQKELEPRFKVQIASLHKKTIKCSNRLEIQAHEDLSKLESADLLLIPTIGGDIDKVLENNLALSAHIRRLASSGADIASNCSGAFLLANSGLLNGKKATTHWGYANKFRQQFPAVNLCERELVTQDEHVFCAGGGVAFNDLCLLLIERYCGRDIANQVAKAHVINRQSGFQSTYANFHRYKQHQHEPTIKVQEYIEANYQNKIKIEDLAELINATVRTLNRNFNKHVNLSPIHYIQSVRIENAKRLLEQGLQNTLQLAASVGYEDSASFSRLFKKHTGLTPANYRSNFQRNFTIS